jgi:hypothetical protein
VNLYAFVGNNPVGRLDAEGLAFYAVGGTWESEEDKANPWELYDATMERPKHYEKGPGFRSGKESKFRAMHGYQTDGIARKVKNIICEHFCNAKRDCKDFSINLTGWSRGATAVMGVAKYLNNSGCECEGVRYQPVNVNWIGLFAAVEMIPNPVEVLPGDQTWPNSVPKNVQHFSHAVKTAHQAMYPTTSFGSGEKAFYKHNGMPTEHGDIGKSKLLGNNYAYEWIKQQAIAAGVEF